MNKTFSFAMILMLAFLVGCGSTTTKTTTQSPFVGGTNGLLFQWTSPTQDSNILFDKGQSSLPLILAIRNDGEYTINTEDGNQPIKVTLDGVHFSDVDYEGYTYDLTKHVIDEELIGKKRNSDGTLREGFSTYVEFGDFSYMKSVSGDSIKTIRARICYPYKTFATANVCVTQSLVNPSKKDSLCSINGPIGIYSSSAPLQVTNARQEVLRNNTILITFKIEHKSTGDFFAQDNCDPSFSNKDVVKVYVGDPDDLFWDVLSCKNFKNSPTGSYIAIVPTDPPTGLKRNNVRLINGEALVQCEIKLTRNDFGNYIKDLPITLEYSYQDDVSIPLLIRHMDEE